MVRLLGPEALGGVPSARTGRPIATFDTSAIGQGMENFGRTVQAVGQDLQQRRDQLGAFEAERKLQEFMFAERKLAQDARTNIPPGAAGGFAEPYSASYRERASQFARENLSGLSPEYRSNFDERLFGLERDIYFDNADTERSEITRYNLDGLEDVLSTLQNQIDIGGHTTLETYAAEGDRLIQSSALSPVDKAQALEGWREGAARTAWMAQLRDDPTGAIQALGFEPTPGAEYQIAGDVRGRANQAYDSFIEFGYTPAQAAGIVGNLVQESGVRPSGAVGDAGTAFGIAQWRGERLENLKQFAGDRGKDWTDFQTQLAFIDHELQTSESRAGERLRSAQSVEEATAAFISFERPQGWTDANPRAGHGWGNRLAAAQTIAGDPTTSVRMIDPRYAGISPDERSRLMNEAEPIIRQRRTAYTDQMVDYASFLRAGNAPTQDYDREEARSVLGDAGADVLDEALAKAEQFGNTVNAIQFASPDELAAVAGDITNLLSSPENFEENAQTAQLLTQAIDERKDAIEADPAAYVILQPVVGAAYQAMVEALGDESTLPNAPGLASAYVSASLNEQARLGVPEDMRTVLSESHQAAIVAQFQNQSEGGQNAAQLMRSLQHQWGRNWPRVFEELSGSGELPGVALVVGTMDRPEQGVAAERLAEAALVGVTKLAETVGTETAKEIRDGLFGQMDDFAASVADLPGGQRTLETFNDAVHLLALSYAQRGESGGSALTKAFNDVLGVSYEFRDGYRVPRGQASAAQVAAGTGYMLGKLAGLPLDVENVSGMSPEEARRQYASSLQQFGVWRTSTDETGLTLYNQAGRVVTVNGRPLTATWHSLTLAGSLPTAATIPAPPLSGGSIGRAIGGQTYLNEPPQGPLGDAVREDLENPTPLPAQEIIDPSLLPDIVDPNTMNDLPGDPFGGIIR